MVLTFLGIFYVLFSTFKCFDSHLIDLLVFLSVRFQPSRTSHRFKFSPTYPKYYLRC